MATLSNGVINFVKRNPIGSFWIGLIAAFYIFLGVDSVLHPQTAQQQQAAVAAEQFAATAQLEDANQKKYLCRLTSICSRFATVRQECATAGSFNTCVRVKLGDEDADLTGSCTNDGKLAFTPDKSPNGIECWVRNHLN